MLIVILFLQFEDIDYHGLTPGTEALAMAGVSTTSFFNNPSLVFYNPAGISLLPASLFRYERYYLRECGLDSNRFPKYSVSLLTPDVSFFFHPAISFDTTIEFTSNSYYEREHRRVNLTEFIVTVTSRTGNQLTLKELIYFGLNFKLYSGQYLSIKAMKTGNLWQEPVEKISSTLSPGCDLGVLLWYDKVSIGAMVEDLYTRISWKESDAFTLDRTYRIGFGLRPVKDIYLGIGGEYQNRWTVASGTEIFLGTGKGGIFIRGGIDYDPDSGKSCFSGGLGFFTPMFRLDGGIRYTDPGVVIAIGSSVTE